VPEPGKRLQHSFQTPAAGRACSGRLVQLDASVYTWLRGGGDERVLISMIDASVDVTSAPNTATQTQLGVSDRRAQGCSLHWLIGLHIGPTSAFAASAPERQ